MPSVHVPSERKNILNNLVTENVFILALKQGKV